MNIKDMATIDEIIAGIRLMNGEWIIVGEGKITRIIHLNNGQGFRVFRNDILWQDVMEHAVSIVRYEQ